MRFSGNVRQVATVTLMCSALIAAGYAPALANNNNDNHHKHWYSYFYDQMESLARSLATLGTRVTNRLDGLTQRVKALEGQADSILAGQVDQLGKNFTQLSSDLTALGAKLDSRMTALESTVSAYGAGWTTLSASVNQLDANVKALDGNVKALGNSILALTDRVQTLEQGGTGRIVVNSQGKVGDFAGFDPVSTPLVAMSDSLGHTFTLQVLPNRLRGQELFFTGDTCTGNAYIFAVEPSPISLATVFNNTVYVTEANATPESQVIHKVALDDSCDDWSSLMPISVLRAKPQMTLAANETYVVK